jgi:hypothetical protein
MGILGRKIMATMSFTVLRRYAGIVFTLLLSSACLSVGAAGQQGSSPLVTSSVVKALSNPPTYGTVWSTAVTSNGDFVLYDFENGAVYQYPAGSATPITVFPTPFGGLYANSGLAVDPWNNLWLDNNFTNDGIQRVPWNPATNMWNTTAISIFKTPLNGGDIQTAAFAINPSGMFAMATENGVPTTGVFEMNVDSSGNLTNLQTIIEKVSNVIETLSIDNAGNIYLVEQVNGNGGLPGVFMVPVGTTGLANETTAPAVRVDPLAAGSSPTSPTYLLSNITGTAVDAAGNLYIGDSVAGVLMVPNESGTLNPADWVMISPIPAAGQIGIDQTRETLYIPTTQVVLNGSVVDVVAVGLGNGELGSSPVGTQSTTPTTVFYSFTGAVTPARFVIEEDGVATPDFTVVSGGTCAAKTTYPIAATASASAVNSCTLNVALNPQHVGSVSAQLLMQTAQTATVNGASTTTYTTVATTALNGAGLAGAIEATPVLESAIGGSLKTPSQITTDTMGNVYVADAGYPSVMEYPAGSGTAATPVTIGTGLTAPTGVAVDGNGDVFIADSSNVYEVPFGPTALNAAGQLTLVSGLGANLRLAADGLGHLYVADPANARVVDLSNLNGSLGSFGQSEVFLTTGFTAPSDVAVDSSNNLYVIDGANLFEISNGVQTTLLSTLDNATGVAVDPSGALYVSSKGGTVRVPDVGGTLIPANQTPIATSVTNPTAVAIDNIENVYLTDATAENIHVVSASGSLSFPNVPPAASLDATITNDGNAPLTVTGYTSSNPADYTASDVSCIGSPVASGNACQVDVTLNPGAGQQGTLTGQIGIQSTAANAPVVVNATGMGSSLAASVSSISVGSSAQVVNTQVTVTVKSQSGTGVPTGDVTVSFPTTTGTMGTVTGTLANGTATLTLSPVAAGSDTFSVAYGGDRTYGTSTATTTGAVVQSASNLTLPTPLPYLPYVLEADGATPFDGSADYWEYNFTVSVTAAAGIPTGTVTFMDGSSVACPANAGAAVPTLVAGQATFATNCLPMPANVTYTPILSVHTITPVYSGDANYLGFTGQPITFDVVRSPAVLITSSPASLTLPSGSSSVSANLTLTSILGYGFAGASQEDNNYTLPVTLACDNLPPNSTCSFTYPNPDPNIPTAVDIPCTGTTAAADNCLPGSVTVTINTNMPPAGTTNTSKNVQPRSFTFAALFGFGIVGLFFRRKAWRKAYPLLTICFTILGGALMASCLSACSTSSLSAPVVLTTPSGTYAVTITAQQVGTQVITQAGVPITIYGSQNQVSVPFTINVTVP